MNHTIRLNIDDWVKGHAEILERQYLFGDQSDFAKILLEKLKAPLVASGSEENDTQLSWLELLRDRLENTCRDGDPEFNGRFHYKFLDALGKLNRVYLLLESDADPKSKIFTDAQKLLVECIAKLSTVFGLKEESWLNIDLPSGTSSNRAQLELFPALVKQQIASEGQGNDCIPGQIGFWLALDLLQQVYQKPLIGGISLTTKHSAVTPVLFWAEKEDVGYVLWLKVELFFDYYPGPFYPDLTKFGLTNISPEDPEFGLMEPMLQVWNASGLGKKFRGQWSITTEHPEKIRDFYQQTFHREHLGGASLQAAALAAVLAASGQIPLSSNGAGGKPINDANEKPEVYSLADNKSLRLNPRVAISAQIDAPEDVHDDSIKLGGVGGIAAKINAIRDYGPSRSSAFDTVLVVSAETKKARDELPKDDEEKSGFSGIQLVENCDTMADALFWMLEVNAWKKELNLASEARWLNRWGYARNADGHFLEKKNNFEPIRLLEPDTAEKSSYNWNDAWAPYRDCIIKVDDDTQQVTLKLGSNENEQDPSQLDTFLNQGLREELERQVKERGINTGSLEFMQSPVHGAVDDGREVSAQASDQPKDLEGMPVADDLDGDSADG